jgi:hypothetical protein
VPTMQDKLLAEFRTRLESDPQLRREFAAAPLGVLRRAGVQVSPAKARELRLNFESGQPKPPVTTISLRGQVPGKQGWLLAPVTVALSAHDFSGTGVAVIETSPDRLSWVTYTGAFLYSLEGGTRLYYRARDNAFNEEPPRSHEFAIDTRAPLVTVSVDRSTCTRLEPFTAHFGASDPVPGSGLATVTAMVDTTPVSNGQTIDLLWYPLGTHVLSATASDIAGSTATRSEPFELIATPESLVGLIQKLASIGQIDSAGVVNSLLTKAQHGQLDALLHEIRAQSGKHVAAQAADVLAADVEYVMAHSGRHPGHPGNQPAGSQPTGNQPAGEGDRTRPWWRRGR